MPFNEKQIRQLLKPVNAKRVLKDGKGNSHLPAFDVIAHLNRVFGFGGFDIDVLSADLVFEDKYQKDGKDKWSVGYKALVRLTVKDENGNVVCHYEDGSLGVSEGQPKRGDSHDLAMKSAISLAIKRAAKDLGDGYGLSLYDKGRMSGVVKATLVGLPDDVDDVQSEVEQVVSIGNDEIDKTAEMEAEDARDALRLLCSGKDPKFDMNKVALAFDGDLRTASAEDINAYIQDLVTGKVKV